VHSFHLFVLFVFPSRLAKCFGPTLPLTAAAFSQRGNARRAMLVADSDGHAARPRPMIEKNIVTPLAVALDGGMVGLSVT
jgi:hypothetical protein